MTLTDLINLVLVLLAIGILLISVLRLHRLLRLSSEAIRKTIHIGIGLIVLPFPWLFHSPIPVITFSLTLMAMFATLRIPFDILPSAADFLRHRARRFMPSIRRDSFGEFYFMLIIPGLFLLAADRPLIFIVPVLLLTIADAAAALLGRRYGLHPFPLGPGHKTLEGCTAFFITAFFITHVPLLLFAPQFDRPQTLAIGFTIASLTTVVEALSFAGLDNLLIPFAAASILLLCEFDSPYRACAAALALAITLLLAALAWRRTTTNTATSQPLLPIRGFNWRF